MKTKNILISASIMGVQNVYSSHDTPAPSPDVCNQAGLDNYSNDSSLVISEPSNMRCFQSLLNGMSGPGDIENLISGPHCSAVQAYISGSNMETLMDAIDAADTVNDFVNWLLDVPESEYEEFCSMYTEEIVTCVVDEILPQVAPLLKGMTWGCCENLWTTLGEFTNLQLEQEIKEYMNIVGELVCAKREIGFGVETEQLCGYTAVHAMFDADSNEDSMMTMMNEMMQIPNNVACDAFNGNSYANTNGTQHTMVNAESMGSCSIAIDHLFSRFRGTAKIVSNHVRKILTSMFTDGDCFSIAELLGEEYAYLDMSLLGGKDSTLAHEKVCFHVPNAFSSECGYEAESDIVPIFTTSESSTGWKNNRKEMESELFCNQESLDRYNDDNQWMYDWYNNTYIVDSSWVNKTTFTEANHYTCIASIDRMDDIDFNDFNFTEECSGVSNFLDSTDVQEMVESLGDVESFTELINWFRNVPEDKHQNFCDMYDDNLLPCLENSIIPHLITEAKKRSKGCCADVTDSLSFFAGIDLKAEASEYISILGEMMCETREVGFGVTEEELCGYSAIRSFTTNNFTVDDLADLGKKFITMPNDAACDAFNGKEYTPASYGLNSNISTTTFTNAASLGSCSIGWDKLISRIFGHYAYALGKVDEYLFSIFDDDCFFVSMSGTPNVCVHIPNGFSSQCGFAGTHIKLEGNPIIPFYVSLTETPDEDTAGDSTDEPSTPTPTVDSASCKFIANLFLMVVSCMSVMYLV